MAERIIDTADLRTIENNLNYIYGQLDTVNSQVGQVDARVASVADDLRSLSRDFYDYVVKAQLQHNMTTAQSRLITVRQELKSKYGHYDQVRKSTVGILQAGDLGIIRSETINTITEEMMVQTPDYWLAPCLVALAAWIADKKDLAEKALKEGIRRNDEKTSLLFALICRRSGRKPVCLNWIRRYLQNQDEESLDGKCVVILDAFASGLLGRDSEGLVSEQLGEWLDKLSEKPGFVEKQVEEWDKALKALELEFEGDDYPYLQKYSPTWPLLKEIMEGASLHAAVYSYVEGVFLQEVSTDSPKAQLDEILMSLVSDFDEEERPLKKEETYNELIIKNSGDKEKADSEMDLKESIYADHKDFSTLLTDTAMNPDKAHSRPSTQKFAMAMSKDWLEMAYNDVVAENRMKIPDEIEIEISSFKGRTKDGDNERELTDAFLNHMKKEEQDRLDGMKMPQNLETKRTVGLVLIPVGAIIAFFGLFMGLGFLLGLLGIAAAIVGIVLLTGASGTRKSILAAREQTVEEYRKLRESGTQILAAVLAEVVDYREQFSETDSGSETVLRYLEDLDVDNYIGNISSATRRIRV